MATIITKNSGTASSVPTGAQLTAGELAVNTADKRLFTKNGGGTVVELGTNPSSLTLPNGTANAVPYLNASKVLTSGSALTFDGTNLGVGLTPFSFGSYAGISVGAAAGGALSFGTGGAEAGRITGQSGYLNFYGGTVGSVTELMRLTATGLGIGTSSPDVKVHAQGSSGGATLELLRLANAGAGANTASQLTFYAAGSNYAQITGGYGASSPILTYNVAGGGYHAWQNNGTTQATLDSSGNLLVGTTSTLGKLGVSNSGNFTNARFDNGSASITGRNVWSTYTGSGNNNTTAIHFAAYDGSVGSDVFQVLGNGNVRNQNNSYGAISDLKLKENVVDATPKLSGLMQVRIVNYNLKTDPERKQLGVIAQELEQVFPGMVEESPDLDMEGNDLGTTTKSVKYSVFVPMLIKAIQEQQAIINELKADVAALKGTA